MEQEEQPRNVRAQQSLNSDNDGKMGLPNFSLVTGDKVGLFFQLEVLFFLLFGYAEFVCEPPQLCCLLTGETSGKKLLCFESSIRVLSYSIIREPEQPFIMFVGITRQIGCCSR